MSASKTDLRLATVQPDLLLSFSLLYFCHFYHVTIWKITAEIHSQGSFLHAPHTERVTRKRRPWERGNRNKLHRLLLNSKQIQSKRSVMSASKTDLRLATVQPDLLLSFSLLYFCHFYHVTIWKITAEIHSQGSFLHAPHTERVTRKRRPWERGNRNKLHRLLLNSKQSSPHRRLRGIQYQFSKKGYRISTVAFRSHVVLPQCRTLSHRAN